MNLREFAKQRSSDIIARAQKDELVQRYLNLMPINGRTGFVESPPITEPWMALAEQRAQAAMIASGMYKFDAADPNIDLEAAQSGLAQEVWGSSTFMWSHKILGIVMDYPMPRVEITPDLVTHYSSYHSLERAYEVVTADGASRKVPDNARTDWLFFMKTKDGIGVFQNLVAYDAGFGFKRDEQLIIGSKMLYGKVFPDDFPETSHPAHKLFLSMMSFLRSPYIEVERRLMPRGFRKDPTVTRTTKPDTTISVVRLRQATQEALEKYEQAKREFKHQWWVSGHHRNQWYASKGRHEMVWIAPYLKGPEGAPMVERVYKVQR